jgi:signal transduction histidine kinase
VIDEGIGISDDKLEKIFSITESISTKGTEDEDGSGLGLILCKEFVEMHGGSIQVQSKIDEGTMISFTIPSADRE